MPASPLQAAQFFKNAIDNYQIQQPSVEYSQILRALFPIEKRVAFFAARLNCRVCRPQVKCLAPARANDCLIFSNIAAELAVSHVSAASFSVTVDFHEQWRKHMTGNAVTPFCAVLEFLLPTQESRQYKILESGVYTFQTKRWGNCTAVTIQEHVEVHAVIITFDKQHQFMRSAEKHRPPNGLLWTFTIAPSVAVLAPFCFVRGWVCPVCQRAFTSPFEFVRHAVHNPALIDSRIVLNQIVNNRLRMTSSAMPCYPKRRAPRMDRHSYIGFSSVALTTRLLDLKRAMYA